MLVLFLIHRIAIQLWENWFILLQKENSQISIEILSTSWEFTSSVLGRDRNRFSPNNKRLQTNETFNSLSVNGKIKSIAGHIV